MCGAVGVSDFWRAVLGWWAKEITHTVSAPALAC